MRSGFRIIRRANQRVRAPDRFHVSVRPLAPSDTTVIQDPTISRAYRYLITAVTPRRVIDEVLASTINPADITKTFTPKQPLSFSAAYWVTGTDTSSRSKIDMDTDRVRNRWHDNFGCGQAQKRRQDNSNETRHAYLLGAGTWRMGTLSDAGPPGQYFHEIRQPMHRWAARSRRAA